MTTITARGAKQRDALSWMLDKPLPEDYEEFGLYVDEVWGEYALSVERHPSDGYASSITLLPEHVEPFWCEVEDALRIYGDMAYQAAGDDLKDVVSAIGALQRLIDRAR